MTRLDTVIRAHQLSLIDSHPSSFFCALVAFVADAGAMAQHSAIIDALAMSGLSTSTSSDCTGTALYSKTVTVTANGNCATDNSGAGASGYTITADGTYKWLVVYNGDSRNNGFTKACGDEQVVVDITP